MQQQALRDFGRAMGGFFDPGNRAGRPSWRKAGRDEGFRITGRRGRQWDLRRVSRKVGQVWVPKAGWARFRWSRAVPPGVKSYRVTRDRAGRWHVAFAVIPAPVPAPGNGQTVGIDLGVPVSAALSIGELLHCPALTGRERARLRRMQRTLARARRGSNRRGRARHAIARLRARERDRRKDWAEKVSTGIARRFGLIRVEDLQIAAMTRAAKGTREDPGRNVRARAGLNRAILGAGWGLLVRLLQDKAPGRVEKISPVFTSQRCSACGHVDAHSRESQARFVCKACGSERVGYALMRADRRLPHRPVPRVLGRPLQGVPGDAVADGRGGDPLGIEPREQGPEPLPGLADQRARRDPHVVEEHGELLFRLDKLGLDGVPASARERRPAPRTSTSGCAGPRWRRVLARGGARVLTRGGARVLARGGAPAGPRSCPRPG